MAESFFIFWFFIAITYGVLAFRNYIQLNEIKRVSQGSSAIHVGQTSIKLGEDPEDDEDYIDLANMFESIFRIDLIALIIGFIAAIFSIIRVV